MNTDVVELAVPEIAPVEAPVYGETVIRVQHVYKQYRQHQYQLSLRHETMIALKRVLGRYMRREAPAPFYALKDVDFTVRKGEAVGIIGQNGSGKTTLLRLLSGITKPTSGEIEVDGRFATMIGLGAGFNTQLTGRKNIYLNAAIFGLHPQEIAALEADIIAFADIGEFIDLPVKVYSSGMVARLGFSVAIHILPDIVFLDEVLVVGDAKFMKKCTERILNFRAEKRTVVLVSHSPVSIKQLCNRVIWLHKGEMMMDGDVDDVLAAYAQANEV